MTLVAITNLTKPLRGGNSLPEKQSAQGGFREALADARSKGGARRDVEAEAPAAGKLTEQLASRVKHGSPRGADWRNPAEEDAFSNKADAAGKNLEPDPHETTTKDAGDPDDPAAFAWSGQNAPATRTPDRQSGEFGAGMGNTESSGDMSIVETETSGGSGAKPAAEAQSGAEDTASDPRAQATSPAVARTDPNASAEIAAILDTRPAAPNEAKPAVTVDEASNTGDTEQAPDSEADAGEVRVLSTSGHSSSGDVQRAQQTPFGSSIAMLNLVTLRGAPADAASPGEPRAGNRSSTASLPSVTAGLPDGDGPSLDDMAPAMPAPTAPAALADEAIDEFKGKVAAKREDDSTQTATTDKAQAKTTEPQMAMPRLSPTAASVVETLASHPATKVLKLETQTIVDQQAGTSATHSLKIQLRPVELGEIVATLRMHGDTLSVEIATEKAEAYERLSLDSDTIVKALRSLGLQIDQVTIQPPQVATASVKSDGAMSNQTSGGTGQQFGQPGASAGGGSEGQRGTASQGDERHGRQPIQKGSALDENGRTGGLFI